MYWNYVSLQQFNTKKAILVVWLYRNVHFRFFFYPVMDFILWKVLLCFLYQFKHIGEIDFPVIFLPFFENYFRRILSVFCTEQDQGKETFRIDIILNGKQSHRRPHFNISTCCLIFHIIILLIRNVCKQTITSRVERNFIGVNIRNKVIINLDGESGLWCFVFRDCTISIKCTCTRYGYPV